MEFDVVVVGAGLSGLEAANFLHNYQRKVVVLEARDRVGGRLYSPEITLSDGSHTVVDAGGAYVGPTQNRVLKLAKAAGIKTYKVYAAGRNVMCIRGKAPSSYVGTVPTQLSPLTLLDMNSVLVTMDATAQKINTQEPWNSPNAKQMDKMNMQEWIDKSCWSEDTKVLITTCIRTVLCTEPSEVSVLFWMWYMAGGGRMRIIEADNGAQERKLLGGSQGLAKSLAAMLPANTVRFDHAVQSLVQDQQTVRVTCRNGAQFLARHVILAIAPPLYSKINFDPALPPLKQQLSQRMPMGCIIKTNMYYKRPFWRESGLSGQALSDVGPIVYSYDDCKPEPPLVPSIMGFLLADHCRHWLKMSKEERKRAICEQYAKSFNSKEALEPLDYFEQDWASEEWSAGCYTSVMPPNVLATLGPCLRQPHHRIHFAGTETATKWAGYMDGALQAGQRAAHEVLTEMRKDDPSLEAPPPWQDDIPEDPTGDCVARPIGPSALEKRLPSLGQLLGGIFVSILALGFALSRR